MSGVEGGGGRGVVNARMVIDPGGRNTIIRRSIRERNIYVVATARKFS